MTSFGLGPIMLLFFAAFYGSLLIGAVLVVRAIVRISHALDRISRSLEDISAGMKSGITR